MTRPLNTATASNNNTQQTLLNRFKQVRDHSMALCAPLETEDYVVQPISDVSPPKWHLAHTTWFFEELLLVTQLTKYTRFDESFPKLFNSYYKAAGEHWLQSERGQLSRPTVQEVIAYRQYVDAAMATLLETQTLPQDALTHLEIGLHHEQQHQELLLMDIKYILGANPCTPTYAAPTTEITGSIPPQASSWHIIANGNAEIGHSGESFGFDNEFPRHTTYLPSTNISTALVSNRQFLEFIEDGGYRQAAHWLSMGWDWVNNHTIGHPLYWLRDEDKSTWQEFTLYGKQTLDLNAPVSHVSYFEANAYATWAGARLPTEQEMERYLVQSEATEADGNLHPNDPTKSNGQLWCWTSSAYAPYPGFQAFGGMLGEYNGKFMCNQYVLRGGCVATPAGHYRHSYRNFYLPHQRWMFSGIRLAKDIQ